MEPLVTLVETREFLRVSRATLHRMLARGELPVVEIGQRTLVRASVLRAFALEHDVRRGLRNDDGPVSAEPSVRTSAGEVGRDEERTEQS